MNRQLRVTSVRRFYLSVPEKLFQLHKPRLCMLHQEVEDDPLQYFVKELWISHVFRRNRRYPVKLFIDLFGYLPKRGLQFLTVRAKPWSARVGGELIQKIHPFILSVTSLRILPITALDHPQLHL